MKIYDPASITEQAKKQAAPPAPSAPVPVSASLRNPKDKSAKGAQRKTNTVAQPPPEGYYVIVGRGLAATVDLSTLLQTPHGVARLNRDQRSRSGNEVPLPVLLIGFADPWQGYENHEMGQIANLLHMPGFEQRPLATLTEPRQSQAFAAQSKHERDRLAKHRKFAELDAAVLVVQPRGGTLDGKAKGELENGEKAGGAVLAALDRAWPSEYPPYRVLVVFPDGEPGLIYAHKVDVCTGAGRPRAPEAALVGAAFRDECRGLLWKGPPKWGEAEKKRKVITGTDGLVTATAWEGDSRVCVHGGGGVAVNMIERAREHASIQVDWVTGKTLHASFANPRNDPLLWNSAQSRAMTINESTARSDASSVLLPASTQWRFGRYASAKKVTDHLEGVSIELEHGPTAEVTRAQAALDREKLRVQGIEARIKDLEDRIKQKQAEAKSKKNAVQAAAYLQVHVLPLDTELGVERRALAAAATAVEEKEKARLAAEQAKAKSDAAAVFDRAGTSVGLTNGGFPTTLGLAKFQGNARLYSRVIFCLGQDPAGPGQPQHMLSMIPLRSIVGLGGCMVGLESKDKAVRVLGIASTVNAPWVSAQPGYKALKAYEATVPLQAIPDGFTLNSLKIAVANRYFEESANTNVNTMTDAELTAKLGRELADGVVLARRIHPNGIHSIDELRALLAALRAVSDLAVATMQDSDLRRELADRVKNTRQENDLFETLKALRKTPTALTEFLARSKQIPSNPDLADLIVGYRAADPLLPER